MLPDLAPLCVLVIDLQRVSMLLKAKMGASELTASTKRI